MYSDGWVINLGKLSAVTCVSTLNLLVTSVLPVVIWRSFKEIR